MRASPWHCLVCCIPFAACGGKTSGTISPGQEEPDGAIAVSPDAGTGGPRPDASLPEDVSVVADTSTAPPDALASAYPAPHPPLPQVLTAGGPSMTGPNIVPIVFPNDALAMDIGTFTATLGATPYWAAAAAEYGVGAAAASPVVEVTDAAPTTIDDTAIASWLATKIAAGKLSPPNANTLYAIYYPASTTITMQSGVSCHDFGGYHMSSQLPDGTSFSYAVIPRCPQSFTGLSPLDNLTGSSSHEFLEAATDPLPESLTPAYSAVDPDHLVWGFLGAEIGDLCAENTDAFFKPQGFPYEVQRVWSDKAAAAGHDPCVPAVTGPYFNSVPELNDTITLTYQGQSVPTKGVQIPVGGSKTIVVDLFSDGPTAGSWSVEAIDLTTSLQQSATPALSFSFDQVGGKNGDKIKMTITVLAQGIYGIEEFLIYSTLGSRSTMWIGGVGAK